MKRFNDFVVIALFILFLNICNANPLEGFDEPNIFKNKYWTKCSTIQGPDGYTYYFMDISILQGQEMKLVRSKTPENPEKSYEELGVNNGDSPRSWASIIRSYGASDKDYGLLYISPNNIVLGVRQENKCYFAYDIKNSKFYGHGKIEEISPFMLIEKDTKLHEPDVLAMLYQVIHTTSFYEKEYSVIIGSLPGCPRLATLQKGLENPNKRVQEISLWCIKIQEGGLSKQDEDIEKLTDYLIEQMSSENPICRMHALKSIGYFKGSCVEKAIPHLEKAIQDEISDIRSSAAYSLGEIGEKTFPALLQCLKSNDASVRFYGLYGFRIAGPKSQSCIKAIIPMLADKEASVRRQALIALETIQYYGDDLIPYLKNLTKDGDKWIKRDAENMLKRIESKKASDTSD